MVKILLWFSRIVLGVVFILSGFLKGIDPLGSAYKFVDYFTAFGTDVFTPFALPLSFAMCAAELLLGLLLLFNVTPRIYAWGTLLFMAFFTPLTLYIAIFDPVPDCGCFGDAIIVSNWETFMKNVPLLGASIFLFYHRNTIQAALSTRYDYVAFVLLALLAFLPPVHGYRNLPLVDYRPFSIGASIPEGMSIPPDAPVDEYKTLLYYERDGEVKEFTQDNYPWQDTTWKFVDSKSILVQEGYVPPIESFVLTDMDGFDATDSVLYTPGFFLLAVSYRVDNANAEAVDKLNQIYFQAQESGVGFYYVTASTHDDIDRMVSQTGAAFPFLQADEIMLKTTIRSNPGLILLHEGMVIGKWHYRNLPEPDYFQGHLLSKQIRSLKQGSNKLWYTIIIFGLILLASFQRLFRFYRQS